MNRLLSAALVLSFSLAACTKKHHLEYGLDVKDTLRINLMQEPPTLDWSKATDTTSSLVINNIMDTLVDYNLADPDLAPVPGLASSWTPSQGAKVWTFTLRSDVKWTDGQPFTPQNVVDGWERLLNPATASEYAYFLFPIKNAKNYNAGKVKDFKEVGVKVNDKGQLVVELEKPMAYFPLLLTHHATCPLRADVVAKFGNKWTDPANIVTLGAYKLKIWEHDKAIVLERNDGYYGEKAKTKNVIGRMINEYSTALNLYDSGDLDFQETLPYKELPQYRQKPGFRGAPSLSIYYYGFNIRKPPFNDLKVRKAFSQAIDRKQITDLLGGGQAPLTAWIPTGMFGYEKDIGLNFNPEAAAKLMDEAGFKDRSKFPAITLAFNTNENHQRVAENVQAQLKKNLGINVQVSSEEWKVYLNRLHNDTPSFFRMGWLADYPDPDNFVNLMTSYSDNNYTGWKNKTYDDLIEQGATQMDKEKRRAIYQQAQKLLTETDVPVIPLFSDVRPILLNERIQNFPVNALNRWILKGVSIK
jgi:oligopeptide transport system substrate-binding protein